MKAQVKSLKVTLGKRELEFTMEEAEALLSELQAKLGRTPTPIVIEKQLIYEYPQPIYHPHRTVPFPQITCHARS